MNNSTQIVTGAKPDLGFSGLGWIGKKRLNAIRKKDIGEIKGVVDPDLNVVKELQKEIENIRDYHSFEEMLDSEIEGVVIASPSALHAEQALAALQKGKAVFCQKPLGRNARETISIIEAARNQNLLLNVDFSYRHTEAAKQVKNTVQSGEIGKIYGVNLVFHNAYGPDKSWYYDAEKSGGGCMTDLGVHLIDMLFWVLDDAEIETVTSRLLCRGKRLNSSRTDVEDFAAAQLSLKDDTAVQLSCSWNLPAGKDVVLEATFYGENGGVGLRNVEGSFYHFTAEKYNGTSTKILSVPPDDWEGRAAVRWSEKLTEGNQFDPECESYIKAAQTLDLIYQNCS